MALNGIGTFRRTGDDEINDLNQVHENIQTRSWTDWPNSAGFEALEEHRGPLELTVRGCIPSWAAGTLYRTGPGQTVIEDTPRGPHRVSHWFDGFAHSHKFDIIPSDTHDHATVVQYSSRRQSEPLVEDIKKKGWRSQVTFAQKADPCVGIFAKLMTVFEPPLNNNSVVVERNVPGPWHKEQEPARSNHPTGTGNLFIMTDSRVMHEVNPDTLEPRVFTTHKKLNPLLTGPSAGAHSQRDPETGDLYNFNISYGRVIVYRIFRMNASTGDADILATIQSPQVRPAYVHSLFLTENYVVLCIPSSHFAWNGIKIRWEGNLVEAMEPFDASKLSQWLVVDRRHGKGIVARFTTPAGFFFHSVNAFEELAEDENGSPRTDLYFDQIAYENLDVIESFYLDVILDRNDATKNYWIDKYGYKTCMPRLLRYRFRMPLSDHQSSPNNSTLPSAEEVLSIPGPHIGELPNINPAFSTKPYRYVYSGANRGLSTLFDSLVKLDLHTRETLVWGAPKGHTPGEPIFVARPDAAHEDDGVLLSVVLDGTAQRSYLLCLDAKTLEEMGRAEADFAIGLGFHGLHAPRVAKATA